MSGLSSRNRKQSRDRAVFALFFARLVLGSRAAALFPQVVAALASAERAKSPAAEIPLLVP
jgi:hypothetical protein